MPPPKVSRRPPRKASARRKSSRPVSTSGTEPLFLNRELSWLDFNQRVLEEARDASNPLLERLKFLAIVSSNLDEFFEIRVAGLQQQAETQPGHRGPDGLTPQQTLDEIAARAQKMVSEQYHCYREEVVPGLTQHEVDLMTVSDLDEAGMAWAESYFHREVFPVLTPLAIDPAHPFPQLLNKSLNLAVTLAVPEAQTGPKLQLPQWDDPIRFGVVQVPRALPRLVALPLALCPQGRSVHVFLSSLISRYIGQLFPGLPVTGCYAFRVTRNSELYLDEDEADNLLEAMREQLQRRRKGDAVRLEVQRGCAPTVVEMLLTTLELDRTDLYEVDGPINLTRLMAVYEAVRQPHLKEPPFQPVVSSALRQVETPAEMFSAIRQQDILLHHPYDSFSAVADFVAMAAADPDVLAIKQTLYRTASDSSIVRSLRQAASNGKEVTALVELKARFDEENNIRGARAMEESGVHVLYGLVGLKTHCKLALVVRREGQQIRHYAHMSTGNYNETTARLYTDVGLLTAREDVTGDAARIFNLLTGMSRFQGLEKLWMAPFGLQDRFKDLIDRETRNAQKGAKRARIIAKLNSLVDPDLILALYAASQAGVRINLIVRGICCLRPGVPGLSENIRVRSIVDRFLEHDRIFWFANDGQEEIYCGSADWMPRNFFRRVEVIFPVEDKALRLRLRQEILRAALDDNVKAREMRGDGSHARCRARAGKPAFRAQAWLMRRAMERSPANHPARPEAHPSAAPQLVPRLVAAPYNSQSVVAERRSKPSLDGRAGTLGDPVLHSLEQDLLSQPGKALSNGSEAALPPASKVKRRKAR